VSIIHSVEYRLLNNDQLGCYIALGNFDRAQELLDGVPAAIDKKKIGGKDLPTEVFLKKKSNLTLLSSLTSLTHDVVVALYKKKQLNRTGSEEGWIRSIRINPAEGPFHLYAMASVD
jgi:hypothetical protein